MTETPPERLPERELFTEYVNLVEQDETPADPYEEVALQERQARLLAEIGERLEALEAAKALIGTPNPPEETGDSQFNRSGQPDTQHGIPIDDE